MKIRSLIIALTFALFASVVPAMAQKDTVKVKGKKFIIHHVEKGETLYSLSRHYGVTIDELNETNRCLSHGLKSGQRLKVPIKVAEAEQKPTATPKADATDATTGATVNGDAVTSSVDNAATVADQPKVDATEQTAAKVTEVAVATVDSTVVLSKFRKLQKDEVAEVVLLLPMGTPEQPDKNYVDFYRGFLLGLDSVRMSGRSVNLNLYNSGRSYEDAMAIINSGALDKANLVVGPVYEDQLIPVAAAMKEKRAPVVSPLARLDHTTNDMVFQMSPSSKTRHFKIPELRDSTVRVVVISGDKVDKRFDKEVREMLQGVPNVINHRFAFEHPTLTQKLAAQRAKLGIAAPGDMKPYLKGNRPTVLIITSGNEFDLSQILEAIKEGKRELTSHRIPLAPHVIVGHTRWTHYPNIEREVLFENNIVQISTYHTRRSDPVIRKFDKRFVREFGALPTRYAYRGYDAAMMFVKELYESIDTGLEGKAFKPLLTPYKFESDSVSGVHVNTEWVKIVYNKNFTISNE